MATSPETRESHLNHARQVLAELGLRENPELQLRPVSGHRHNASLLLPCVGEDGHEFLLKFFAPPVEDGLYPPGMRPQDFARREAAFYRFLDTTDPSRRRVPAPRSIMIEPHDPPRWILLEWIHGAVGPAEEVLGIEQILEVLRQLREVPIDLLLGRRDFPLNHWDVISCLEQVRLMYEPAMQVIGSQRWRQVQGFFDEAVRWTDSRPMTLVHGDFTEQNLVVDRDGRPFLIDFEQVGIGNENHDFAWLWIHSERSKPWKRNLLEQYLGDLFGSDRIKSEWGIRTALVYLALRRLRYGVLSRQDGDDPLAAANLALLDAALAGGSDLFPPA